MPEPVNVFEDLDREPGQPRMSDLWEWARDDYRAGESADVVCERHRLSRSQFFERARREGWLRRDQSRTSAEPSYDAEAEEAFVEDALDRPPPSAYALYRRAWARVERAILMGRRVEAAGWTRLARDLRKLACEEAGGAYWTMVAKANEAPPDSPDSVPRPPTFTGEVAAQRTEGAKCAPPPSEPARSPLAPSVTTPVAPRHLPRCAREVEGRPDSPDSPTISVHPRGSGAPGLSGGPDAEESEPPVQTEPPAEPSAQSLGPRIRQEEREGGGGCDADGRPDSPDSASTQAWSRLATPKPSRRGRRRVRAGG